MARSVPGWFFYLLAVALGGLAAAIDLHHEDVQAGVLALAGSTFVLCFLRPGSTWASVLVVGAAIPVTHVVARAFELELPHGVSVPRALLAFIPAAVGAVAARRVRKGMAKGPG